MIILNSYGITIQFNEHEKLSLEETAEKLGFKSANAYLYYLHKNNIKQNNDSQKTSTTKKTNNNSDTELFFKTGKGKIYCGDSLDYLFDIAKEKSVDLIMTSPPFGLIRKKSYGNEDSEKYCDWFRPFAKGFKRVLKDCGSLVIDIGGAWKKGMPSRSLYHFELLLMLCKEYGFHLCQEHYWWNPSKLPTPAEWVNVKRVRVKDAVNCIWWLSKTPYPKASNYKVLFPYSKSMQKLLINGYKTKKRPSGHIISGNFMTDNGGSVPPNLLAIANTESNEYYLNFCKKNNLKIHPARFPSRLPEYFIKFLTDPGDVVLDPFAGSCVTGMVAENLDRKWTCVELDEDYLSGAVSRFFYNEGRKERKKLPTQYKIWSPCPLGIDESKVKTIKDG